MSMPPEITFNTFNKKPKPAKVGIEKKNTEATDIIPIAKTVAERKLSKIGVLREPQFFLFNFLLNAKKATKPPNVTNNDANAAPFTRESIKALLKTLLEIKNVEPNKVVGIKNIPLTPSADFADFFTFSAHIESSSTGIFFVVSCTIAIGSIMA